MSLLRIFLVSWFATASAAAMELDRIIAVVDEDVVMQSELDQHLRRVRDELRRQGTELPPISVLQRQVMERLILQKIQLQLAERIGIVVSEEGLDAAINDIAKKNNLSMPEFREILRNDGYDFNTFRENIREEIIVARLRREEVEKRVQVTDREIENYLRNQSEQEGGSEEVRLSHILVGVPTRASDTEREQARQRAEEIGVRLQVGEDFAQLAVATSDAQDALEGGDLGWRAANQVPSVFADVVNSMEVGEVSELITSPNGFHFVTLTDRRSDSQIIVEQTRARHILIIPNAILAEDDALNRLRQLRLRIEGGADFGELARTNSDDRGSALEGGDLGWVSGGQMVPEFEEVMNATAVGEIKGPFRTQFGWHILEVTDRRSYDGTDEVRKSKARDAIAQRKKDEAFQTWLRQLRDEAYVELRADE